MRKIFYILSVVGCAVFIASAPMAGFAFSKGSGGQNGRGGGSSASAAPAVESSGDSRRGNSSNRENRGNRGNQRGQGRQQSSGQEQPAVAAPAQPAQQQPIIINNYNTNNNNSGATANNNNTNTVSNDTNVVVRQQQTQYQAQRQTATAIARSDARAYVAPTRSAGAAYSAPYVSPRAGYWDEGAYFGMNAALAKAKLEQSGPGYSKVHEPAGFGFDFLMGYKFPFFRIGGEIGLMGGGAELPEENETDKFNVMTFMPHVFLELDNPERVMPYVGVAAGFGIFSMTYENTITENSVSKTGGGFTYALMLGLRVALTNDTELNLGYRYQDYGNVKLSVYDNKLTGHSLTLGLAFKF